MRPSAISAAFRRKILSQPGITARPVCGACQREVEPRDFGRQHCKACEADRAAASAEWDAMRDAEVGNGPVAVPAEPMFGSEAAARPFLPGDEEADRFAAFLRRLAETLAYAIAGDTTARLVMGEYGLARWCGVSPERALVQAERMVADAFRSGGAK